MTALEAGGSSDPAFPDISAWGTLYARWRFREDYLVTDGKGRITQALDASGNGRHTNVAAGLERPRFYPKHFNGGYPAAFFNGTSNKLTYTVPLAVTPPLTVVTIIQDYKNGTGNCNIVNCGFAVFSNGPTGDWRIFNGTVLTLVGSGAANELAPLLLGHIRHPTVRMSVFNGASSVVANNDTETAGAAGTTSPIMAAAGTLTIGDDGAGTGWMRGLLGEVAIIQGAPTLAQRDALRTFYNELFGIAAIG